MTEGEKKQYSSPSVKDAGKIIEAIPKNIERKVEGKPPVPTASPVAPAQDSSDETESKSTE
jgi:hypothetical protein